MFNTIIIIIKDCECTRPSCLLLSHYIMMTAQQQQQQQLPTKHITLHQTITHRMVVFLHPHKTFFSLPTVLLLRSEKIVILLILCAYSQSTFNNTTTPSCLMVAVNLPRDCGMAKLQGLGSMWMMLFVLFATTTALSKAQVSLTHLDVVVLAVVL